VATLTGGAGRTVLLSLPGIYTVTASDEAFVADPTAPAENPVLDATASVTVM
jgi:hypothetical protein